MHICLRLGIFAYMQIYLDAYMRIRVGINAYIFSLSHQINYMSRQRERKTIFSLSLPTRLIYLEREKYFFPLVAYSSNLFGVQVYTYMHICTSAGIYAYMQGYGGAYMYTCMIRKYMCIYSCMYAYRHAYMEVYMQKC